MASRQAQFRVDAERCRFEHPEAVGQMAAQAVCLNEASEKVSEGTSAAFQRTYKALETERSDLWLAADKGWVTIPAAKAKLTADAKQAFADLRQAAADDDARRERFSAAMARLQAASIANQPRTTTTNCTSFLPNSASCTSTTQ